MNQTEFEYIRRNLKNKHDLKRAGVKKDVRPCICLYIDSIFTWIVTSPCDPSDPMHWNKEQYIHHLKEMVISVKSTWRLDMIRQLYFEKYKNTPQREDEVPQDTVNINDNASTEPSKEQNEIETQVQQTNQNSGATHTEELLKETTCAL